jgi:hypothetical protein
VGVIASTTVQLALGPSVGFRQVDDGSTAYGVPEETLGVDTLILLVSRFVSVTVLNELDWPTTTFPNDSEAGDTVVGFTPVPLNATVFGLLVELLVIESVPAGCTPTDVGLKITSAVQLAPAAKLVTVVKHVPPFTRA